MQMLENQVLPIFVVIYLGKLCRIFFDSNRLVGRAKTNSLESSREQNLICTGPSVLSLLLSHPYGIL